MFLFNWIRSLLAYFGFKKNAKLLIIGLDNAGKSTLLTMMSTGRIVQHAPTPKGSCQEMDMGTIRFTAYDLGGHPQGIHIIHVFTGGRDSVLVKSGSITLEYVCSIRRVWRDYYPAVDGIIFMVDCADHMRFDEAKEELDRTIRDDTLPDAPIAVLFNKTDRKEAVGEEYLSEKLMLGVHRTGKKHTPRAELSGRPLETFPSSIVKQTGYGDAMRWLAYYIE